MEDITCVCPEDDVNKDRVSRGLEYEYSEEEESDDDIEDIGDINNDSIEGLN